RPRIVTGAPRAVTTTGGLRMRSRAFIRPCRFVIALALVAGALLLPAASASAGIYNVYACGGPAGGNNNLFHSATDPGMTAYVANCPVNPYAANDDKGLVTRSVRQNGSVGALNGAYLIMDAPAGAQISGLHAQVNVNRT